MALRDLAPWNWGHRDAAVQTPREHPVADLHRQMNRLFDQYVRNVDLSPFGVEAAAHWPSVDIGENDKEITVTAELPGMSEDDIDVSLTADTLTIRGEKKAEKTEEGEGGYRHIERTYGSFHREIPLPAAVKADEVDAGFANGVLTVKLPKDPDADQGRKRIKVKTGGA